MNDRGFHGVALLGTMGSFLLVALIAVTLCHYFHYNHVQVAQTEGIIDEILPKDHNSVVCHYSVNGVTYHLKASAVTSRDHLAIYDHIIVYYDAAHPDDAALDSSGFSPFSILYQILFFVVMGSLGFALFMVMLRPNPPAVDTASPAKTFST